MNAITVFCTLCLLLVGGKIVRLLCPFLQRLYLPSSVIGGLLGLLLFSTGTVTLPPGVTTALKLLPGFLINVIFAAMFLGAAAPKLKAIFRLALPQLCMGQLLAWGQYVIGLGLVGFLLIPLFGANAAMGNLLEIGLEGGHGTVGGMSRTFREFNWEDGIALGYTVATVGMILGIVVGMALINWALSRGFIQSARKFAQRGRAEKLGIYPGKKRPPAGMQTVFSDSIDSLGWHIAMIGTAILIGFAMLRGLQHLEILLLPENRTRLFAGFPLFPLCMIGGVLLQIVFRRFKLDSLIDHGQMQRISGAALDFLVAAAVSTIQITVVARNWLPLLILVAAGLLWSIVLVLFLAPKLFPTAWFECAIAEFGQGMGVTATGLMLLRTVDPENRTPAAAAFGCKQLLHEPVMGGGLWTVSALMLVFTIGWLPLWGICTFMLLVWLGITAAVIRNRRKESRLS